MAFSILSWNVEKFDGEVTQLDEVSNHISNHDPDVFGILEVENVGIVDLIVNYLDDYDYHLTDGPQNKEILVGVRRNKFEQVTFSQKRQFKVYNPFLRPGAFLTLKYQGAHYNVLYLHTDSGTEAPDFGNRTEMFEKIWRLRLTLNKINPDPGPAKFIVLGDLNTMGLQYPYRRVSHVLVNEEDEIAALKEYADRRDMVLLTKEFDTTFNNLRYESNLDHIITTENISFRDLGQRVVDGRPFQIKITGWHQLQGAARTRFINEISDHCSLYCEIQ